MNYTILQLVKPMDGYEIKVELVKNGNQYYVGYYNSETKAYTHSRNSDLETTTKLFTTITIWFSKSLYDENYHRQIVSQW